MRKCELFHRRRVCKINGTPRNVRRKLWFRALVSSNAHSRRKFVQEKEAFENIPFENSNQVFKYGKNSRSAESSIENSVDVNNRMEVSAMECFTMEQDHAEAEESGGSFKMFQSPNSVDASDDNLDSDFEGTTRAKIVHLRNTYSVRNCPLDMKDLESESDSDSHPFDNVLYTSKMKLKGRLSRKKFSSDSSLERVPDDSENGANDINSCSMKETDESVKIIRLEENATQKYSTEEKMNRIFAVNIPEKNQIVLILHHPAEVVIKGISILKVISGTVTVCGYTVDSNKPTINLFSLKKSGYIKVSTSVPELRTLRSSKRNIASDLKEITGVLFRQMKNVFNHSSVVLLLQPAKILKGKVEYALIHIGENYLPSSSKQHEEFSACGLCISPVKRSTKIACNINEEWLRLGDIVQDALFLAKEAESPAPRVVICGGKNSGKSTLLRYLMNTILTVDSNCYHLEADIGQTEFSPPGCISLTCVDKPLFGPPFTHLKNPEKMYYLGAVSVKIPDDYLNAFTAAFEHYRQQHQGLPLFVNTMGWTRDLGLVLLIDILHIVQPTHIIQINFEDSHKGQNLPSLTPQFVYRTNGWRFAKSDKKLLQYHLIEMSSISYTGHFSGSFTPVETRNLAILSYLSRLQTANCLEYLPINSFYPYMVPWSAVTVYIYHHDIPQYQVLYALNATWVALCKVQDAKVLEGDDDFPKMLKTVSNHECLGFGIVRGIDTSKKLFYIITPEPIRRLQMVNALVRGSINFPDRLLLLQEGEFLPYCKKEVQYSATQ